ncbi:MAG: permease [Aeromonas sp.]
MNGWLTMLTDASQMFLFLALELSVLFLVISAGVSLIRQKIPDAKIQAMLGARKGRGYLIAAVLGALTPFCSCSTIPMLRGLLSAKAGFGPTLTFLFVSPLLNPIIVGLMWATFGWKVTALYAVIAAGVSVLAFPCWRVCCWTCWGLSVMSLTPPMPGKVAAAPVVAPVVALRHQNLPV